MLVPLKLLIVEDNPDDCELMVLQLEKAGFLSDWQRVDTEAGYLVALEGPLDLILSDWSLPNFSGLRALNLHNELDLDIPFIIVSGSIGEEAACTGVYLHGLAGDHAKQNIGEFGLIATDLIHSFAAVLKDSAPSLKRPQI